jgi:hypothetical protein
VSLATDAKTCCAATYGSAATRLLLGESFHPGGLALTERLIAALPTGAECTLVDVAAGTGASASLLVEVTCARVVGIDLVQATLAEAQARAHRAHERLAFVCADADALPFPNGSIDGLLCECAFCLFPDGDRAAHELRRVLRPGGRLALSDVWADQARLPVALRSLEAYLACVAGARPLDDLAAVLAAAGFVMERVEREDGALGDMLERIGARLRVARLVPASPLAEWLDEAERLLAAARHALADGVIGYGVIIARA